MYYYIILLWAQKESHLGRPRQDSRFFLPNGQGLSNSTSNKIITLDKQEGPWQAKCKSCLSKEQVGIKVIFLPPPPQPHPPHHHHNHYHYQLLHS